MFVRIQLPCEATLEVEATTCPVCSADDFVPFREEADFTIVRCESCGLRYLNPRPTAAALKEFYGSSYFQNDDSVSHGYSRYVDEADLWRATFRNRLRLLPPGRRLLDVGAAAGFFVEQARLAGWDAEGIEPSEWAARFARETLNQPVRTGLLETEALPRSSYDIVTLWEVIEHVPDPATLLRAISDVLVPGGYLVLSTPDAGSAVARLAGRRWLGWRKVPEHLSFFDYDTLRRLLGDAGYTIQDARYVSLTVTLGFATDRLSEMLGARVARILPDMLRKQQVPVNPLYDLCVVARKSQ